MGKALNLIVIISFLDLLFLLTGQYAYESLGSALIGILFDPASILTSNWYSVFFTPANLVVGATTALVIAAGILTRDTKTAISLAIVPSLVILVTDYVSIFTYVNSFSSVLAVLIFGPLLVYSVVVFIEWVLAKD